MGNHAVIEKFLQSTFGNPINLSLNIKSNEEKLTKALEEHKNNVAAITELKSKLKKYQLSGEDAVTAEKRTAVNALLQKLNDQKLTSTERLSGFQIELKNQEQVLRKIRDPKGNCLFNIFQPITHVSKFLLNKMGFFTVRGQRVTQELNEVLSKRITP